MDRQGGQATVEWVALLLLAALILGAAAAHSFARDDRGLGRLVAKRMASAPRELRLERDRPASPGGLPGVSGPTAGARAPALAAPPVRSRSVGAGARLRGTARVAERAWIVCLGYRRLRHDLEHPRAPNEAMPLGDALEIANTCLNPYSFFLGD